MFIGYIQHSAYLEMFARGYTDVQISMPVLSMHNNRLSLAFLAWQGLKKQRNVPAPSHVIYASLVGSNMDVEEIVLEDTCPVMRCARFGKIRQNQLLTLLSKATDNYLVSHKLPAHLYLSYLEQMLPLYPKEYYPLFKKYNLPNYNIKEFN